MRSNGFRRKSEAMHNLRTAYYTQFVHNVQHLLSDDMHVSRNDFDTADARYVTRKFLQQNHTLGVTDDSNAGLCYFGNLNPKSFRYVMRLPCSQIDRRPVDMDSEYIV